MLSRQGALEDAESALAIDASFSGGWTARALVRATLGAFMVLSLAQLIMHHPVLLLFAHCQRLVKTASRSPHGHCAHSACLP